MHNLKFLDSTVSIYGYLEINLRLQKLIEQNQLVAHHMITPRKLSKLVFRHFL